MVSGAITRPQSIIRRFVDAIKWMLTVKHAKVVAVKDLKEIIRRK